jgi:hypothetical protein
MHDVDPRVSTDCKFFTSTNLTAILSAARAIIIVTAANKPSGTFATIIPIPNVIISPHLYPMIAAKIQNNTPKVIAITEMSFIKLEISLEIGVS